MSSRARAAIPAIAFASLIATPVAAQSPEPAAEDDPRPPETTLGLQLSAGLMARIGSETTLPNDEPVDLAYGAGAWFAPTRLWSVGLAFQRVGLGGGETDSPRHSLAVQRDVNTLWLGGRAYPWRSDELGVYVGLALGASWQEVSANGARERSPGTMGPIEPFACSASDGPGFALSGAVGLDAEMGRGFAFLAEATAAGHRLTSEPIGACAPGSGSVTGVGAQIGFMYRFDLRGGAQTR